MTLNMPQLLNSFPTSAAAGEGFESQYVEKFFLEAAGIVPIGAIVAWAKSFAGVPALEADTLFVECNGQVLNDPASLLDGQTMPDLNTTQRFLRGNTTSGTTAGDDSHAHGPPSGASSDPKYTSSGTTRYCWGSYDSAGIRNATQTTPSSSLPVHYEIVWLIRVK